MAKKVILVDVPESAQKIPRDYAGYVFVSDIDKTYLATQIDSVSGLLRAAFETAERKSNVPGFSTILRAVRRGAIAEKARNPIYFVSASPPQIGTKILQKMEIDGVEHDGIIFKNQFEYLKRWNFKKLKEQVGYKLGALLSLWKKLPKTCKLVLFGDDSESDAIIFSIFSEILAKNISRIQLVELLRHIGVFEEEALRVAWLARQAATEALYPVQAAFINLDTGSNPAFYARYGSNIFPTENSLQTAFALFEQELIRDVAVITIAKEMVLKYDYSPKDLLKSLEIAARRGLFTLETLDKLWPILARQSLLTPFVEREQREGAVTKLNPRRWNTQNLFKHSLSELKLRYRDEGRY